MLNLLLTNRNFSIYWSIGLFASIGSFFSIIAMPWMVLDIYNNDPFIMATVMAAGVIPQSFFILFAGAISDKFSAIRMVIASRLCLFSLLSLFSIFLKIGYVPVWLIYLFAFLMGTCAAIMGPSNQSLLTAVVSKAELDKANALSFLATHIAHIVGPLIAGFFIFWSKQALQQFDKEIVLDAYALAFLMDASILLLVLLGSFFIRVDKLEAPSRNIFILLREGFLFCKRDEGIRIVLFYIFLVSFFFGGALMACLPIYIKLHMGLTEQHYGNFYMLIGIGTVIGIWLSTLLKPSNKEIGLLVLCCDFISGLCLILLGHITEFAFSVLPLLVMGLCGGIVMSAGTTWFQRRTPPDLMGRVMSILVFSVSGLVPLSTLIFGLLLKYVDVVKVLELAGGVIIIFTVLGIIVPRVRMMGNYQPLKWIN